MTAAAATVAGVRALDHAVRLLGPPAVRVGGDWVPLRPGRADAVFAFVARRGAPVRRAEVAALLWPEMDGRRASTNLRQALRGLVTGPLGPLVGRDRERLWVEAASDVPWFEQAVREARWDDAVAAYGGSLLEGFELDDAGEFGSWLDSERAAVGERWRRACVVLVEAAHHRGDHADALRIADLVVRADPLDEAAVRLALRAAAALGDRAGVRRRFEALRTTLEREVGVAPEAATVAIAEGAERVAPPSGAVVAEAADAPLPPAGDHGAPAAPARTTARRLVGRDDVLSALRARLVDGDERLVTVLAPGGMGKTVVAVAFVERSRDAFPDGAFVVDLEAVGDGDSVVLAVASALGVRLTEGAPPEGQVVEALASRAALLVFDACERHLDAVDLVDHLLADCAMVRVLATSRARLRHSLESVLELGALTTQTPRPPTVAELEAGTRAAEGPSDAARLFRLVAARRLPGWVPDERDEERVEAVCRVLGGAPLAIELAASWLDVMPLEEVERRASSGWDVLSSDEVDRGERHGSVEAMLADAWGLLGEDDRAAWARLAVMPGTIDRSVAAAVVGTGWRGLRRLVDRALVRHVGDRLELHALPGRFGRERAAELGLAEGAWDAALSVWRERVPQEVDPATGRYRPLEGDDLVQVVGALRRAVERREWSTVGSFADPVLRGLWRVGRFAEGREVTREVVAALARGRGAARDVALARWLPELPVRASAEARANAERALRLAERRGDDRGIAAACEAFSNLHQGVATFAFCERARNARRRCGDEIGRAMLDNTYADTLAKLGYYDRAIEVDTEALEIARRLGDVMGEARAIDGLTTVPLIRGEAETVRRGIAEARRLFERSGARHEALITLATESWLCAVIGEHERSLRYAEAFVEGHRAYGDASGIASMMFTYSGSRRGDHAGVLRYVPRLIQRTGAPERISALGAQAYECLTLAHVQRNEPGEALPAARHLLAQVRGLGAPGPVATALAVCGHLAEALGEPGLAIAMLERAWAHPSFGFALQRETREALERLGVVVGPPCTGAMPDTLALVDWLEAGLTRLERAWAGRSP